MLIKKVIFVAILATVAPTVLAFDMAFINEAATNYGVQSNAISEVDLIKVLEECRKVDDWANIEALPLSSVLRAQLSSDTTLAKIGDTETFKSLFPANSAEIAAEFKKLVAKDSTSASRNAAIDQILTLKLAAPTPVAVAAASASNAALVKLRQKIAESRWDRSGDMYGEYNPAGIYETYGLDDADFANNWKSAVTDGCSPLILAIILKDVDAVKALVEIGANVNEVACNLLPLQAANSFAADTEIPKILQGTGATV